MKKIIICTLLACMASPALAVSTTRDYLTNQCLNAGHGWATNVVISNVFPTQMAKTLYFGDKRGRFFQIGRLNPNDDIVVGSEYNTIIANYLKATVYNSVALAQPVSLCVDASTSPDTVLGIYTEAQ